MSLLITKVTVILNPWKFPMHKDFRGDKTHALKPPTQANPVLQVGCLHGSAAVKGL